MCLRGGHEVRLYADGAIAPGTIDRIIVHLELLEEHLPFEGPREQVGQPLTLEHASE